jgi:hypothetical protein
MAADGVIDEQAMSHIGPSRRMLRRKGTSAFGLLRKWVARCDG